MKKDINIRVIEETLKRAFKRGELRVEFSDEDIEFLLGRSPKIRPSRDLTKDLEEILLEILRKDKSEVVVVNEEGSSYEAGPDIAGRVLGEAFRVSGLRYEEAAKRLATTPAKVKEILTENMPVTADTVHTVAEDLVTKYGLSDQARALLVQWLLNGLHLIHLKRSVKTSGSMRAAARKGQKRKRR